MNFTKYTASVQFGAKMNWLDVEVKRSRLRLEHDDILLSKQFGRHFLTYLGNTWAYFNDTCHSYSL